MKSDEDIKQDVFEYIKGSELHQEISGELCKYKRERNSKKEDILISILANENGQMQDATVNVNIYVQDKRKQNDSEENGPRIKTLCRLASNLFDVFRGPGYRARLLSQRVFAVDGAEEHVINNKIEYKYLNE